MTVEEAKAAIESTVRELFDGFVQGTKEQSAPLLDRMVLHAQEALVTNDPVVYPELQAQFESLAEAQRVRAVGTGWTAVFRVLEIAVGLGRAAIGGGVA